jgi:predicted SnoaL-like aldol condensation-catalyzing enzyme
MSALEQNKKIVVDYYQTAFGGNPEKAIADHFGPRYVQHNRTPRTARRRSSAS